VRAIKLALLAPLGLLCARRILRPRQQAAPDDALECFFCLYCAAFLWLDLVWEATLSIVIFAYLLGSLPPARHWLASLPFILYAIADLWQVSGMALATLWFSADQLAAQGPPLWADPSYHIPIILLVLLAFYGLLVSGLLRRSFERGARPAGRQFN